MTKTYPWQEKPVMSVPEMCRVLGISKSLGFKMVNTGELPSIRLGEKRIVVPTAAVTEILKQGREGN